jgi:hypothetical protein
MSEDCPLEACPKTVKEAVDLLICGLTLKDKVEIARLDAGELESLLLILGEYIKRNFGLWNENSYLVRSCQEVSGEKEPSIDRVVQIIIDNLWKRLKKTHLPRIVK